jgi:hypothetical protein
MKKRNKKSINLTGDTDFVRERIFEYKNRFHKDQAKLAYAEKIRILVELQKTANEIKSQTGRQPNYVWRI